jgi:MFS family permease
MIKQVIHRLLRHRHFWREIGFDELSEIYVTQMFRSLSISLTGIFVPLYMLKLGYVMVDVIVLVIWYFVARALIFDLFSGWLVARTGPKHTIIYGYLLLIVSTALFLTLPHVHWPLWLVGGIWGGTSSLFCIPFDVDFSKVKHKIHGGKELGYVNVMDKFGGVIGPLVGGIVATVFGGQYIFLVAMALLVIGGLPLLKTREQIPLNQSLNLRSLDIRRMRRDLLSFIPYGIELTITGTLWPLYLGLFVLVSGGAYAKLGVLASVSVIASMATAFAIGKLIDRHHGRQLLRFGATINALLHLFRPFVTTYPIALLVNIVNEGATIAYHMPYTKGMYDVVDDMPDHRIAYFVVMELTDSITKGLAWIALALLTTVFSDHTVIVIGFIFGGALSSLLIMTEKFVALNAEK